LEVKRLICPESHNLGRVFPAYFFSCLFDLMSTSLTDFLQIAQPPFFPMIGFVKIVPFGQRKERYYRGDPNDINYQKAVTILCRQKIKRHAARYGSCFSQGMPFDQNKSSRY